MCLSTVSPTSVCAGILILRPLTSPDPLATSCTTGSLLEAYTIGRAPPPGREMVLIGVTPGEMELSSQDTISVELESTAGAPTGTLNGEEALPGVIPAGIGFVAEKASQVSAGRPSKLCVYSKRSAELVALMPPEAVTVTSCAPLPGGATA